MNAKPAPPSAPARKGTDAMAEVTGPISTLPGKSHDLPDGAMCDEHPDRKAVARIQGETDSFGAELNDMCQECLDQFREECRSPEARSGQCDWCKGQATDLSDARDYDEGMRGPVYRVCGACRKRRDDEARAELEAYDDYYDDFDEMSDQEAAEQECGRWMNGKLGRHCSKAGSEECDCICPLRTAKADR